MTSRPTGPRTIPWPADAADRFDECARIAQAHLTRSPAMPEPTKPLAGEPGPVTPSRITPEHRARAIAAAVHLVGATAMTNLGYVPDSQLQEAARVADSIADYIAHGQMSGLGMRR